MNLFTFLDLMRSLFTQLCKISPLLALIITLSACQNLPKPVVGKIDVMANQQAVSNIEHWAITGKVAFISPKERKSVYVNWQQAEQQFTFKMTNLLGITLATVSFDGKSALLKADGKEYQHVSASTLIEQVTGWTIPIEQLSRWIKAEYTTNDKVTRHPSGLVLDLYPTCKDCLDWQIHYPDYISVDALWLPASVTVEQQNKNTAIKFRIIEWNITQ